MVRVEEHKELTAHLPVERAPLPQRAYIPLSQHLGKMCLPEVAVGDAVTRGQRIGSAQAQVYAPVHASISGKVAAIHEWPHPVLGSCMAVVIESDGQDRSLEAHPRTREEVESLPPEQVREAVREAGVVGMGGASFPTHIKLQPAKPVDTLIINGAECEPYLTCDSRLMVEHALQTAAGVRITARCLDVRQVVVAIEDNKPEAAQRLGALGSEYGFQVRIFRSRYPQGAEKQLVKAVTGREVPRGKLPFDAGVVVQNVATAHAVYDAVALRKPLYERIVTVTGGGVAQPKNLLARVGTPVKELIAACGGYGGRPGKLISGGPMMGIAQYTDDIPVTKAMSGILVLPENDVRVREEEYCIRCGACVRGCPMSLLPTSIAAASRKESWQLAKTYGAADCIECGICSYVCPSGIRLVQSIRRAKQEVLL